MNGQNGGGEFSALERWIILVTLTLTTMLYAMTVTIANVSLPQMQGTLSATQDQIAWVVTFNIVATAVATPTSGWLAARFGRRNVMIYGVLGFTLSSLACGAAGSLTELVLYRIGQGLFGAPLVPLSQAVCMETFPERQRPMAMSVFGMGVILGPILAPTLGGILSENYGWRWVFYMIVPFGITSFIGVWRYIHDTRRDASIKLDWTGFISLAIAIACFQLMLDRGERNDWFEASEIIIYGAIAAVAFYIFIAHSVTAEKPFLSPALLLDRNMALGLLFVLIFGMLNFTPMTLLPAMMQRLQDYPDSVIGLLLASRGVGTLIGFTYMLYGQRFDARYTLAVGFAMQGVSGLAMSQFDINVSTFAVLWTSCLQGLGVGLIWVPLTVVSFSTLAPHRLPEATAVFHLIRNIGSSIYISISVAVVIRTSKINYAEMSELLSPYRKAVQFPFASGDMPADSIAQLSNEVTRQALMVGYLNAFYLFALTAFVVVPMVLLFRKPPKTT